jgi:pimeloyl-ACP methyl ester carboxylesterase
MELETIKAGSLEVAYMVAGPNDGWPCVLCHGFPYDPHAFAETAPHLAAAGARVIIPYLRGYGPTRFLSRDTLRSGEQAVLACDLLALLDALGIAKAVVGGFDWGGRACCIVSALWPERVIALVSGNAYNIQNIARSLEPASAEREAAMWYQYYFHSERGRRGLAQNRREITRLWKMWSPRWLFDEETFERSAAAFDNPDFVDVVIHSIGTASASFPAIRPWPTSKPVSSRSRQSRCQPSRSTATPMASTAVPPIMRQCSPGRTSTGCSRGPGTTRRRSDRPNGLRPCSMRAPELVRLDSVEAAQ